MAGMGLAVALAALIVLAEFSRVLSHRTTNYLRHLHAMNQTVQQLKRRIVSVERRSATVAERASADETLKRIVAAPDLRTIKLTGADGSKAADARVPLPSGTLAMSAAQRAAVLQVAGIRAATKGTVYRVWWEEKRKPETLAAEFIPDSDGKATVPMPMPPQQASTVTVTREVGTDTPKPSGATVLKGRIPSAPSR
jgi:Anti-sigma-K factor rskA